MQQPALRCVNAARKRGVQAEGLRTYLGRQPAALSRFTSYKAQRFNAYRRPTKVLLSVIVHDKHVCRLHHFLLNARGGQIDVVATSNTNATTSSRDPAERVETAAEVADVVGRV